jgi:hypothetical protein
MRPRAPVEGCDFPLLRANEVAGGPALPRQRVMIGRVTTGATRVFRVSMMKPPPID